MRTTRSTSSSTTVITVVVCFPIIVVLLLLLVVVVHASVVDGTSTTLNEDRKPSLLRRGATTRRLQDVVVDEDDLTTLAGVAQTNEEMNQVMNVALELQNEKVEQEGSPAAVKPTLSMEELNHLFSILVDPKSVNNKPPPAPPAAQGATATPPAAQEATVTPPQQQVTSPGPGASSSVSNTPVATTSSPELMNQLNQSLDREQEFISSEQCDLMPVPHVGNTSQELRMEYRRYFRGQVLKYQRTDAPGTLIENMNRIATTVGSPNEGNFILWGYSKTDRQPILEMSAYSEGSSSEEWFDLPLEAQMGHTSRDHGMRFVNPFERDIVGDIPLSNIITIEGDHLVMMDRFYDVFAHFFLDFIPYLSYLKDTLPPTTKILLADTKGRSKARMEEIDPDFTKERITWINCEGECRNVMVKIRGGGSLQIFHPLSNTRHMDLLLKARRWIFEQHPPTPSTLQERTVVYYTRNHASAMHGRAMSKEQETLIIQMIKQTLQEFGRNEQLLILDGTQSFQEQIQYFQSANFVIGAHGGGMANLLFTLPSLSSDNYCQARPKVLEFLCNPLTPEVQPGSWYKTYYNLYTTSPWVEYHHVLYKPPSDGETTYIDLGEFREALRTMFGGSSTTSSIGPEVSV